MTRANLIPVMAEAYSLTVWHWVRSTSAKTKGLDYSLRLNLGLSPKFRPNLTSRRRFGLRPDLSPNFGLSLKAKTRLSSTFGLRLKS